MSAALPLKVVPPLFNRYEGGETYGNHVDGAVHPVAGTPHRVRTDLSATLFLSRPEEYDGGELVIDDTYGSHRDQAAGRRHDPVSRHQPAPGRAGHQRRAPGGVLLGPEHGARRQPARPAVRSRHRDPAARRRRCPTARRWRSCSTSTTTCCGNGRTPDAGCHHDPAPDRAAAPLGRAGAVPAVGHARADRQHPRLRGRAAGILRGATAGRGGGDSPRDRRNRCGGPAGGARRLRAAQLCCARTDADGLAAVRLAPVRARRGRRRAAARRCRSGVARNLAEPGDRLLPSGLLPAFDPAAAQPRGAATGRLARRRDAGDGGERPRQLVAAPRRMAGRLRGRPGRERLPAAPRACTAPPGSGASWCS